MCYVFDIDRLHAISCMGGGKARDEMVDIVVDETAKAFRPASTPVDPGGGCSARREVPPA